MNDIRTVPSVFQLSLIELAPALLASILAMISFHYLLWTSEPYGWQYQPLDEYPLWFVEGREELFRDYRWFIFILSFIATICLIRSLRRQVHIIPFIGRINFHGYLSFSWPIILLIPTFHGLFVLFSFFWMLGLIVASFIIYYLSMQGGKYRGNMVPIVLNIGVFIPIVWYSARIWGLMGD